MMAPRQVDMVNGVSGVLKLLLGRRTENVDTPALHLLRQNRMI
jgi:hypothetical protein